MLGYLGWILFALLLVWSIMSLRFSHRKRLNLNSYVAYLLLSDQIREKHKHAFVEWIRGSRAQDAMSLWLQADSVTEGMADQLANREDSDLASIIF